MVKNQNRALTWWCGLMLLLLAAPLWAATITVTSDRNPVAMGESFRLVFEADGAVDDDPDFKPLEQAFEIRQQSQGTTMQIVNGKVTQSRQWTVVLMPKRAGRLEVPKISFGKDQSEPLVITVNEPAAATAAANNSALFIEVSSEPAADSKRIYVQSQVIYKARLFRAVNVANARLSEPVISDADAVIEKLGDDREFETTRNGRRYVVLERSYAIFPQQRGTVTIAPLTFEGQLVNRTRGMFDMFDQSGPIRRITSEAITLDVQPIPAGVVPQQWLPAREVRLVEEWPAGVDLTQSVVAGEPLTWTLTLIADGLTAAQLPTITPEMPTGVKAYPDQARQMIDKKQDRVIGVRQEKIALIPTAAGEYLLPAIEVPWWNTQTGQQAVARLPARTLTVSAAPSTGVAPVPSASVAEVSVGENQLVLTQPSPSQARFWQWVSGLLALGWLLTAVAWLMVRNKREPQMGGAVEAATTQPALSAAKKALQAACHRNDAPAAKVALLAWAAARWPEARPGSLADLAQRVSETLRGEVEALNRQLYSHRSEKNEAGWNGQPLWAAFKAESVQQPPAERDEPVIAPMYP